MALTARFLCVFFWLVPIIIPRCVKYIDPAVDSPFLSSFPMSWGSPIRDLKSVGRPVEGHPQYVQQVHQQPQWKETPTCIWERELYEVMAEFFNTANSAGSNFGLGIVCMTRTRLVARMRITSAHRQPAGLLHGGVSALIGEELGSIASALNIAPNPIVGTTIVASHIGGAKEGQMILAICTPIKRGGALQVWKTEIYLDDEQEDESAALASNPLHYLTVQPKGKKSLLSTCQLTTMKRPQSTIETGKPTTAFPVPGKSKL